MPRKASILVAKPPPTGDSLQRLSVDRFVNKSVNSYRLLPGFTFRAAALEADADVTIEQYTAGGHFVLFTEAASPFWLADWLLLGEDHPAWQDQIQQAVDFGGRSPEVLDRYKWVAQNVPPVRRRHELSFEHHVQVAQLMPEDQDELLADAVFRRWTVAQLRQEVRARKRRSVLIGQAALEGMFRVIYADPPWLYNDRGVITEADGYGRAARHYEGMTIDQLCKVPVKAHATPDSVLFLWVTAPMLYENPGPREVIEAWGYTPKTGLVWDKVLHNFGHYVSVRHEHLIIATRGSCVPDHPTPMPDSVQTIRRTDVHSEKPAEFRAVIDRLYDGPKVELFARRQVPGWTCWGNQILADLVEA